MTAVEVFTVFLGIGAALTGQVLVAFVFSEWRKF